MDARNDNQLSAISISRHEGPPTRSRGRGKPHVVLLRNFLQIGHHLVTCHRVQSTGGFVQEQDLWARDELARNTYSADLATTESLADWGAKDGVCVIL